jgi:hypothetical protein
VPTIIRPEITGRSPDTSADWIELRRIIDLKEASRLSGLSIDSLKRHHRSKFIQLSERRCGMRIADALMLSAEG